MTRSWGWWTEHKLDLLGKYLDAFAQASKKAPGRVYLDLFAGTPENVSRDTNARILGSVHRALAANPPFTRICLFELPGNAEQLERDLREKYPGRQEIAVYPGDTNTTINQALADLAPFRMAPTFAFVDQYDSEVYWSTLEQIARFKDPSRTKAEMWILLGTSFYARGLRLQQAELDPSYADGLTRMFGSEEWRQIAAARRRGLLAPVQWRAEIVNLMRWRLEHVLGYEHTRALSFRNTAGAEIYDMIFASDHPVGDKIMRHLYGRSPAQQSLLRTISQAIRRDKTRQKQGEFALFDVNPAMVGGTEVFGEEGQAALEAAGLQPPHPPYQIPEEARDREPDDYS